MGQIARIKTWASGDQPTAPDLNGEFNNFLNAWNQTDSGILTWGQMKSTNATSVPLIVNATGTQNIANFQSSGTTLASIFNNGFVSSQSASCPGIIYVGGASSIISSTQGSLISTTTLSGSRTLSANMLRAGSLIKINIYGKFTTPFTGQFFSLSFNIGSTTIDSLNPIFGVSSGTVLNFFSCKIFFILKTIGASATGSTLTSMWNDGGDTTDSGTRASSNSKTTSPTFDSTVSQSIDVVCSFTDAIGSIQALGSNIEVTY